MPGVGRAGRDAGHGGDHASMPTGDALVTVTWGRDEDELRAAIAELDLELRRVDGSRRPLGSAHEGWAVIKEELDELWDHVRADTGRTADARREAIQVATTALRYCIHIAPRGEA